MDTGCEIIPLVKNSYADAGSCEPKGARKTCGPSAND